MNLTQLRWNDGHLEYRSREPIQGEYCLVITYKWGPWKQIEAVRGDETDGVRFGPDAE